MFHMSQYLFNKYQRAYYLSVKVHLSNTSFVLLVLNSILTTPYSKMAKNHNANDIDNGNTYWMDSIEKEMKNVMCAFEFNDGNKIPIGHKKIEAYMIFDVKMMTLTRKARLVAGGHLTDPPKESVYSSVVSRESVRLAFLAAALNDNKILSGDI